MRLDSSNGSVTQRLECHLYTVEVGISKFPGTTVRLGSGTVEGTVKFLPPTGAWFQSPTVRC